MRNKQQHGGILLYVLVLWGIIMIFLSITVVFFSSSVSQTQLISDLIQREYEQKNIYNNIVARYRENGLDVSSYIQQAYHDHSLTRFSNDSVALVNPNDDFNQRAFWEFYRQQEEIPFIDSTTDDLYPNDLYDISNWKISWNMDTDTAQSEVMEYNPLKRNENADIRVTMMRISGGSVIKKCFDSNNSDVSGDIAASGVYKSSLTLQESYFKEPLLDGKECEIDSEEAPTTIFASPVDLSNNHYILAVQSLGDMTHVKVEAIGNSGYIPTDSLDIEIAPKTEGDLLEDSVFIGGVNSAIFSLLDSSELVYEGDAVTDGKTVSEHAWKYLMGVLVNKY